MHGFRSIILLQFSFSLFLALCRISLFYFIFAFFPLFISDPLFRCPSLRVCVSLCFCRSTLEIECIDNDKPLERSFPLFVISLANALVLLWRNANATNNTFIDIRIIFLEDIFWPSVESWHSHWTAHYCCNMLSAIHICNPHANFLPNSPEKRTHSHTAKVNANGSEAAAGRETLAHRSQNRITWNAETVR